MFKLNKISKACFLPKITDFVDTHPIGRIFQLGKKKTVWKRVTELTAGVKIAIENDGKLEWDEIVSVKKVGSERVYDIEVEGTHNFVANGILAHNTQISLTDTGDLNIAKDTNGNYVVEKTASTFVKTTVDKVGAFSKLLAADFEAGIAKISEIVADKITVTGSLISPVVQTDLISPLADSDTVTIQTKNLVIENASGSAEVKIVGDLTAENASVSGQLYAESIVSPDLDKIQELLRQVKTDQDLLTEAANWSTNTATESAVISEQLTVNSLFVTSQAAISSLSVSNSLSLGTDLVIQTSSINTLTAPLSLQSLAMAPVEMMAGKIRIETNGDVIINANLIVSGKIESGSIKTKEITTERLVIAMEATSSASLEASSSGVINTNATAGKAVIPAGIPEIAINNPNISDYTLIYVTPTSSTENNVLFVKSKEAGKFAVGFTTALNTDVNFNWWIIETR